MRPHRPFGLVLGGGGARGFAHLGVLRALESDGYRPRLVVGVSMGALVGVAYAGREDWYNAVLNLRPADFPGAAAAGDGGVLATIRLLFAMLVEWGPGTGTQGAGLGELRKLVGHGGLDHTRIPVAVTATDLRSGERILLRTEPADEAVYASGALAGILPPLTVGEYLLADGAYTDLAPVDVARDLGATTVIAVDAGQLDAAGAIRNGYGALTRAMEICHRQHADLRFAQADLVLRPRFRRSIGTLEFSARRECVAAGIRIVRAERRTLQELLRC